MVEIIVKCIKWSNVTFHSSRDAYKGQETACYIQCMMLIMQQNMIAGLIIMLHFILLIKFLIASVQVKNYGHV